MAPCLPMSAAQMPVHMPTHTSVHMSVRMSTHMPMRGLERVCARGMCLPIPWCACAKDMFKCMARHVCRHVHKHEYEHVHRHAYGRGCGHACGHVFRHVCTKEERKRGYMAGRASAVVNENLDN